MMNECVERDIIASFEHNEWKIYLPHEKNSESFHFQTILLECLQDVAVLLRDYLFMSMTTLRNLSRKIYLEALVILKEESTNQEQNSERGYFTCSESVQIFKLLIVVKNSKCIYHRFSFLYAFVIVLLFNRFIKIYKINLFFSYKKVIDIKS